MQNQKKQTYPSNLVYFTQPNTTKQPRRSARNDYNIDISTSQSYLQSKIILLQKQLGQVTKMLTQQHSNAQIIQQHNQTIAHLNQKLNHQQQLKKKLYQQLQLSQKANQELKEQLTKMGKDVEIIFREIHQTRQSKASQTNSKTPKDLQNDIIRLNQQIQNMLHKIQKMHDQNQQDQKYKQQILAQLNAKNQLLEQARQQLAYTIQQNNHLKQQIKKLTDLTIKQRTKLQNQKQNIQKLYNQTIHSSLSKEINRQSYMQKQAQLQKYTSKVLQYQQIIKINAQEKQILKNEIYSIKQNQKIQKEKQIKFNQSLQGIKQSNYKEISKIRKYYEQKVKASQLYNSQLQQQINNLKAKLDKQKHQQNKEYSYNHNYKFQPVNKQIAFSFSNLPYPTEQFSLKQKSMNQKIKQLTTQIKSSKRQLLQKEQFYQDKLKELQQKNQDLMINNQKNKTLIKQLQDKLNFHYKITNLQRNKYQDQYLGKPKLKPYYQQQSQNLENKNSRYIKSPSKNRQYFLKDIKEIQILQQQVIMLKRRLQKANKDVTRLKQCIDQKLIQNQLTPRQPTAAVERAICLIEILSEKNIKNKILIKLIEQQKKQLLLQRDRANIINQKLQYQRNQLLNKIYKQKNSLVISKQRSSDQNSSINNNNNNIQIKQRKNYLSQYITKQKSTMNSTKLNKKEIQQQKDSLKRNLSQQAIKIIEQRKHLIFKMKEDLNQLNNS